MNTQKVVYLPLSKAKKAIILCIMAQNYMPKYEGGQEEHFGAVLWGQSGIGKNGITNNIGVELSKATGEKWRQVDVNLSGMSPEDIHGVPAIRDDVLKYFTSLNFDKDEKGIFRLDEIDRPAYFQTLIEMAKYAIDRTDHRHCLPNGMFVLGMGNGNSDTNTQELSEHLKGRFCHLYVSENAPGAHDDHINYLRSQNVHESLIRLVKANPIITRDEFEESAMYHKRSIMFANAILTAYKDFKKAGKDFGDVLLACLAGVMGKNQALETIRYEEMNGLPTLEEIAKDPLNALIPDDLSLRHRFATLLVHDAKNRCDLAPQLIEYLSRLPSEMARFGIDKLIMDCPELVRTSQYIKWTKGK
jgi:MoxR-like ATPase